MLGQDQARVDITLKDGRILSRFVAHAVGSVENPMTDAQLNAKFIELAAGILPEDRTRRLMAFCRDAEQLDDAGDMSPSASPAAMRKLCRNWLCPVPSMTTAIAGTVESRHVSNRSAQKPAVHFASARPTGWTLACGEGDRG